jgi:hypothetical protein
VEKFSPGGRTLLIEQVQPSCSDYVALLSLSFAPFRGERSIRSAVGGGAGRHTLAPGLVLNARACSTIAVTALTLLTERRLLPGAGYSLASAAPHQASCDRRLIFYDGSPPLSSLAIVSPVRSGRWVVAARHRIVALHTSADLIDAQWCRTVATCSTTVATCTTSCISC